MEHKRLNQICGSFRGKLKLLMLQAGLSRLILLAVLLLAVLFTMDWWAHLARPWRAIALLLFLGAVGVAFYYSLLAPLRRRWTDREVLSYADAVLPPDQAMLLDLYELTQSRDQIQEATTPTGQALADAAVAELANLVDRVQISGTLRRSVARDWLVRAGVAVAVVAALVAIPASQVYVATGAIRLFNPLSTLRWPHKTTVDMQNVPNAMPQLESLTVNGVVSGEVPDTVTLYQRTQGRSRFEAMPPIRVIRETRDGREIGRFDYTFAKVRDPLEFYVVGGDYDTDRFPIGIIGRPFIEETVAELTFPRYARIPNRTEKSKQLKVLEGTNVRMVFKCNMELKEARLIRLAEPGPDGTPSTQPAAEPELLKFLDDKNKTFVKEFVARDSANYTVELIEAHGFKQAGEERISIAVERDQPPKVVLLSPSTDLVQTNKAAVDVMIQADDDYGIQRVEMVYQLDGGPEIVLDDNIAGMEGMAKDKKFQHRFNWQLRKSNVPEKGRLTCYVRVKDVNPIADRGWAKSTTATIDLVRPTEFHLSVIEQAKGLLNEARNAWLYQLRSYNNGQEFLKKGTGQLDDSIWTRMQAEQTTAFDAAKSMRTQLKWLTEQYERNQMAREFMSPRLVRVANIVNKMIDEQHKAIKEGFDQSKPATAEVSAAQMLQLRRNALTKFNNSQKLAVLLAEQIIIGLYDWHDLQLATVTTTLMAEQEQEVIVKTEQIASKFAGKQREDLSDLELDELLTVSKQQRTIFDMETGLESQMDTLIFRARMQKRVSVFNALWAAWTILRENRVNDKLKAAAELIANNQAEIVLGDQRKIVSLFRMVENGLIAAGARTEPDPQVTLAMNIQKETEFDPQVTRQVDEKGPDVVDTGNVDLDGIQPIKPPPGTQLVNAIRKTIELQDDVRGRLFYLAANNSSAEMPRFIKLKELMLIERQAIAVSNGLNAAVKIATAEESRASDPVQSVLTSQKEEIAQLVEAIKAHDVGGCHRRAQQDFLANLGDVLEMLSWEAQMEASAAEKKSGVDQFGRQFVVRNFDKDHMDLDSTVGMIARLSHALALERDVVRKLNRFASSQPDGEPMAGMEKTNRTRASKMQKEAADLVSEVIGKAAGMSTEIADFVNKTGVPGMKDLNLANFVDPIAKGSVTPQQVNELKGAQRSILMAMQNLRDMMEERIQPPPASQPEDDPDYVPPSKIETKDVIAELDNSGIPAPMIERMKRALENDAQFPARYSDMLKAYYGSFTKKQAADNGGGQEQEAPVPAPNP